MLHAIRAAVTRSIDKGSSSLHMALVCLALIAVPAACSADVFKWIDENGKVHFGDRPPADAKKQEIKGRISTYSAGAGSDAVETKSAASPQVVMYSTDWCGYCRKARKHFRANNIDFRELDIEKNSRANQEYKKLGGNGVPLIVVGTKLLRGFSADQFDHAYARK